MRQRYQRQIEQIKKENKEAIEGLLEEFKSNLIKVHSEYKNSESFAAQLKDYYQKKLEKQESTHEEEVMELKLQHQEQHEQKLKDVHEKTNERTKRLHIKTGAEERLAQVH